MGRRKRARWGQASLSALLPESAPAADGAQHMQRELTSLTSLEEAVAHAPLGFRDVHHVTALLMSRERRALLLLSDDLERSVVKANMDLFTTMRTMFVDRPRQYSSQERRHLLRQLLMAQQVGLPLSACCRTSC
ncbi:uncharacterized protein LOC119110846 [Pollicipes pollicipes]|uniref:uncharacterized protein LOC119110846 n=1 Tax=Pollicipes pollicipes TaxID=41117 RepID=UPI0018850C87|nr:uncharacterized protein LOC119110846 [Pollicipes pollicipes]